MRLSFSPGGREGHNRLCPLVVQARAAYLAEHLRHIRRTPPIGPRKFLDWAPAFPIWAIEILVWALVDSPRDGAQGSAWILMACGQHPQLMGGMYRLGPRAHLQFRQDLRDMVGRGLGRRREALCDLGVAQPLGQQQEDLELAWRETDWISPGGGARAAWKTTNTGLAQPLARDLRGRRRAQA